jgi:hypothetical protein
MRAAEKVFGIALNDISGRIHPDPVGDVELSVVAPLGKTHLTFSHGAAVKN